MMPRGSANSGHPAPTTFCAPKMRPLYVPWDPQEDNEALIGKLEEGLERYRRGLQRVLRGVQAPRLPTHARPQPDRHPDSWGSIIAWGKNKSESRVHREFYTAAVEVIRGAEALGGYIALPQQEAFDIEYWQLEEAKLRGCRPNRSSPGTWSWWSARAAASVRRPRTASLRRVRTSSAPTSSREAAEATAPGADRPLRCGHRCGGNRYLRLWPC